MKYDSVDARLLAMLLYRWTDGKMGTAFHSWDHSGLNRSSKLNKVCVMVITETRGVYHGGKTLLDTCQSQLFPGTCKGRVGILR